jgi:biotin transporter BioY
MRNRQLTKIYAWRIAASLFVTSLPLLFVGWLLLLLVTPLHDGSEVPGASPLIPSAIVSVVCAVMLSWLFYSRVSSHGRG